MFWIVVFLLRPTASSRSNAAFSPYPFFTHAFRRADANFRGNQWHLNVAMAHQDTKIGASVMSSVYQGSSNCSRKRKPEHPYHQLRAHSNNAADYVLGLINEYKYRSRVMKISKQSLPLLAEVFEDGHSKLCQIVDISMSAKCDPKFAIRIGTANQEKLVDLVQITTIWKKFGEEDDSGSISENLIDETLSNLPIGHVDQALNDLYQDRINLDQSGNKRSALTKKKLAKIISESSNQDVAKKIEAVVRPLLKTGTKYSRLVDSSHVQQILWRNVGSDGDIKSSKNSYLRRACASHAIANDAKLGGRFKRMPCLLVFVNDGKNGDEGDNELSISLINGGWILLDEGTRAGTEARKFADRGSLPQTSADERIVQRLECLAMGEDINAKLSEDSALDLEQDVRVALLAMGLPTTPDGARDALLRIGRWNQSDSLGRKDGALINPWPQDVLQAAGWYQKESKKRKKLLADAVNLATNDEIIEGCADLTHLPTICIDAARTSFRDDAIGIRSRSSTGRKVVNAASKWEILIHIVDVSDLYALEPVGYSKERIYLEQLSLLRKASETRGASRYDLPLGPLHLMPPAALTSLSLESVKPDRTSKSSPIIEHDKSTVNRCVTIWAYIDERNGKIIDAGLERTLISCPVALSFSQATQLLENKMPSDDPLYAKLRGILSVVERNLQCWWDSQVSANTAANAREKRLAAKELVSKQFNQVEVNRNRRDDGSDGFQRSRGHRLVDISLELYGRAICGLLQKHKATIPFTAGSRKESRQSRIATAPLRRYIDGMAQRQALAVLCKYGGQPMTQAECAEIGKSATQLINSNANNRSKKSGSSNTLGIYAMGRSQQVQAIRNLQAYLGGNFDRLVPAMATGTQSQVVILGVGAVADCRGIKGTLKPGTHVSVKIQSIDVERGFISAIIP